LLQQGKSPDYVREQMGHASIQITVDLYGRWLPKRDLAAVDALDDVLMPQMVAAGSRTVAAKGGSARKIREKTEALGQQTAPPPSMHDRVLGVLAGAIVAVVRWVVTSDRIPALVIHRASRTRSEAAVT